MTTKNDAFLDYLEDNQKVFSAESRKVFLAGWNAALEHVQDEYWMCLQSDLENGVKSLNEEATLKFRHSYRQLAGFGEWLDKQKEPQ